VPGCPAGRGTGSSRDQNIVWRAVPKARHVRPPADGLLALALRDLFTALGGGAHAPHGACPHPRAALHVRCKGVPGPLPHSPQRSFRPRALQPQPATIVALARRIEAILIKQEGVGQGTEGHERRPVAVGPGDAGGVYGAHRSDVALPDSRSQWAKPWAVLAAGATAPHVLIKEDEARKAHVAGLLGHGLWPTWARALVANVMAGRLAARDGGGALPMRGAHRVAPGSSPRWARCA
jgi:hypothetical protein